MNKQKELIGKIEQAIECKYLIKIRFNDGTSNMGFVKNISSRGDIDFVEYFSMDNKVYFERDVYNVTLMKEVEIDTE